MTAKLADAITSTVTVSKFSQPSNRLPKRRNRASDNTLNEQSNKETTELGKVQPETNDTRRQNIQGLKYFDMLIPLLEPLHREMCGRDKAGNRELFYDKHCLLLLLYMFNPTVTSLRAIAQVSDLEKVQKKLGCKRTSLSSLSEASRVFVADRLKSIIKDLGEQAGPVGQDVRLSQIDQTITLVDGSLVSALPSMIQASLLKQSEGSGLVKWRLHTHFEVDRYLPTRIDVTPDGGGEYDERAVAERTIEKDRLYVMDRGYAKFALFNDIVDKNSSYVCRLRDNSAYDVLEQQDLSQAAVDCGVLSDQIISIGKSSKAGHRPKHKIRLVCVKCTPHTSRGKSKLGSTGVESDGILRIATNLLDVPADIIALIYSQRWMIEIFFRFFKQFLGCSHLVSRSQNGIEMQVYCAIIACLLINLWTGRKPTKRTFEMISYYFMGLASEAELLGHLAKLKRPAKASENNR